MRALKAVIRLAMTLAVTLTLPLASACAQGAIQQSGPVVAFHAPAWFSNGVQGDAGSPPNPYLSALGIFSGSNCPFGVSSQTTAGPSSAPHSLFTVCQTSAATTLTFAGVNGQSNPAVYFNIGGANYGFPGPGNGNVIGPTVSINGDLACWNTTSGTVLSDCGAGATNVTLFGAKCDGTTDDTAAFSTAFATVSAVQTPAAVCYSATGITVPPNHRLAGTVFNPGNPVSTATSVIKCPANIATACVTLGDGTTNAPTMLSDISVLGSGVVGASSTGVHINAGYNVTLQNVNVRNFGYLYHWQSYASAGAGISGSMINAYGSQADTAYVWYDAWPELHIQTARFGANGAGDYNPLAFFLVTGGVGSTSGGPNGLTIENGQFNQGAVAGPQYGFYFSNLGAGGLPAIDATEYRVTDSHFENLTTAFMGSDSSWNLLDRVFMTHVEVNTPSLPCLGLNSATNLADWQISNNLFFCSSFTISPSSSSNPLDFLKFTANTFLGTFTIGSPAGGSTAMLSNNYFGGAFTSSGPFGSLNLVGDVYGDSATFGQSGTALIAEQQFPAASTYSGLAAPNIFTNNQTVGSDATPNWLGANGPAGSQRIFYGFTAGVARWNFGANDTAESGANAGSDWNITRFSDGGTIIDSPLFISRSTGRTTLADGLSVVGSLDAQTQINIGSVGGAGHLLCSAAAPTISSGFGVGASIVASNGTCSFQINVGTGGAATSGVIGLPAATTGWVCQANDITTTSATVFITKQTASTTATATVGNFNTSAAAAAWVASDKLNVSCLGY